MMNFSWMLAGLIRLLGPFLLLLIWHRKTGARCYPALIAYGVCLPVFIVGAAIRSGLSQEDIVSFCLQRGLLFGILEEGTKYLMMRFFLGSYDNRKDAVTYGIGHGAYESLASGLSCLGMIGSAQSGANIPMSLWEFASGALSCIALTVMIFYGIQKGRAKIMLPAAILIHAVDNASVTLLSDSDGTALRAVTMIGAGCAAYFCWRSLRDPYEEAY